jgi:hypothetical protein
MIVSDRQYQRLLHEQLKAAAPNLWLLLNLPLENTQRVMIERHDRLRRRALVELRRVSKLELPRNLILEDD